MHDNTALTISSCVLCLS